MFQQLSFNLHTADTLWCVLPPMKRKKCSSCSRKAVSLSPGGALFLSIYCAFYVAFSEQRAVSSEKVPQTRAVKLLSLAALFAHKMGPLFAQPKLCVPSGKLAQTEGQCCAVKIWHQPARETLCGAQNTMHHKAPFELHLGPSLALKHRRKVRANTADQICSQKAPLSPLRLGPERPETSSERERQQGKTDAQPTINHTHSCLPEC